MTAGLGAHIQVEPEMASAIGLFGETTSSAIVSVKAECDGQFTALAVKHRVPPLPLGMVQGKGLVVNVRNGTSLINTPATELRDAYEGAIPKFF